MSSSPLTIGKLARAAGVKIETVRYYQVRKLLPIPSRSGGGFRYYPVELIERIRFIKRSQELGFSLDEIRELLRLEDGLDRSSIRTIARRRLEQIDAKLADLSRMREALHGLIDACEHTKMGIPCPIIAALAPRQASEPKPTSDKKGAS